MVSPMKSTFKIKANCVTVSTFSLQFEVNWVSVLSVARLRNVLWGLRWFHLLLTLLLGVLHLYFEACLQYRLFSVFFFYNDFDLSCKRLFESQHSNHFSAKVLTLNQQKTCKIHPPFFKWHTADLSIHVMRAPFYKKTLSMLLRGEG